MKQPVISFNARGLQNYSPIAGTRLIYNTVDWNIGNAFNQSTGIFTAPVNGTYQFSVIICTHAKRWGSIQIMVNQQAVQVVNKYNQDAGYTTASGVIIVILIQGDQVQIKQQYTTGGYAEVNHCRNQFNAALIDKYP